MTIQRGFEVRDILRVLVAGGGSLDFDGDEILVTTPDGFTEQEHERICNAIRNHRPAFLRLLGPSRLPLTHRGYNDERCT